MPGKKTLTLGITVNLDNYENLRLEVAGEVESQEDADELAGFLDEMLGRLGRGDDATAERVDAYRRRVFSTKETAEPIPHAPTKEQTVLVPPIEVEEEEKREVAPEQAPEKQGEPAPAPSPEPVRAEPAPEKPAEPAPAPSPEPERAEPAPEKPAEPTPTQAADEAVCEECGAAVQKTQKQMSQLFLNKTLCKGCMDKLTHPQ
ncbi:outer membrane biosynthesis protein TonB [Methanofollis sp. W23]|uniref:hypothetical protein n=1 Tax=Methanofollis sp. W23 TaxID=2817849 RepID=UPI001AE0E93F|nr:hypothetical protein [Methanofollis sp. W23]MBP2144684.1 outer membrane biosynthesis protein TonB [Methanofollis sp. W23]